MKHIHLITILLLIVTSSSNCKKNQLSELDKLPPATQTGANTLGCLVNGNAWIPDNGCTLLCPKALKFYFDNSNGGSFTIQAEYKNLGINRHEFIGIGADSLLSKKSFASNTDNHLFGVTYSNYLSTGFCRSFLPNDTSVSISGNLVITKFDLNNSIISGSFEFTISKPSCETIQITNGRFDAKL